MDLEKADGLTKLMIHFIKNNGLVLGDYMDNDAMIINRINDDQVPPNYVGLTIYFRKDLIEDVRQ